ncbi:sulfonate ABC transporter substrate-binding protein [Hansschlegelia zhihuaiae]|uniref:Putative aliphatic sulfonates-binding protein n=1 Tax=Hansschlegelia zhihuaiae TaxID=405005 RepID=A0A4Q0MFQ6_9HYPH|nr:sulfonate ABC transporter substrate-binding protein [Hansschlegelia zhihuaiae]RXF72033.1 sulfonate ABC transporter substrate-binding protein [Hansschlegelia zhihuaiae]
MRIPAFLRPSRVLAATLLVAAVGLAGAADAADRTIRIGYQKYGTLILLKGKGALEERLKPLGVVVKWAEFPAGPQLLEALNAGAIDFGTTGEAPPIFAQAASSKLAYVGHEPPAPRGEAIVVPKNSPIRSVAELKGKTIAFNKGSNVHYLLVKALEKAGVAYSDVKTSFLPPADARAAFERGSVDAWVIWDPFLAASEATAGARVLADGEGLVANHQFFLADRTYAEANKEILKALFEELVKVEDWVAKDSNAAAAELAPAVGIPAPILKLALQRQAFGVRSLGPEVVEAQQRIADVFLELKLLPKPIKISDAVVEVSR